MEHSPCCPHATPPSKVTLSSTKSCEQRNRDPRRLCSPFLFASACLSSIGLSVSMPIEYHLAWHRIVWPHPPQSVLARVGLVFFPRFDHTHHGSLGRSFRGGLGACAGGRGLPLPVEEAPLSWQYYSIRPRRAWGSVVVDRGELDVADV
eukprot:scaffold2697_cov346-Pavlova_lutheri.AAC.19